MPSKPTTLDIDIAKRFVIVRKYLKLSQGSIAEVCDLTQGMISYIEKGIRELPVSAIKLLFIKLNISPAYLIAGEGPIEYKKEAKTLITDTRELRAEIEIMRAELTKVKQDIRILIKNNNQTVT